MLLRRSSWYLLSGAALLGLAGELNFSLFASILERPFDVSYVPNGAFMRVMSLGHRTFVSDLYWLQTVQYIGDFKADQRGYDRLLPLLELVTDLDPRHGYAYQTGGIVLSAARRLDESNRILKKGIDQGPNWWTFPWYISFNYWFYQGDYEEGARWAEIAARTPGATTNIRHLALSLASKTGKPEDALAILLELRASAQDEKTQAVLEEQIKTAILERDAQRLEALAARYAADNGHPIQTLLDLVSGGYLPTIPPDPFGGTYRWVAAEGRVHSSANPFRFSPRQKPAAPPGFQFHPPASEMKGL